MKTMKPSPSLPFQKNTPLLLKGSSNWPMRNDTCVRLENITIPDTVTKIGKQAFYNCLELHELTLPSGIKELGDGAFGLYAESDDTSPSVVKDFSVTYGKNSKIKKYVSQYKIPATETAGSNSWVVPVCIGGGVVVVAAIVVILVVRKKRKGGAA